MMGLFQSTRGFDGSHDRPVAKDSLTMPSRVQSFGRNIFRRSLRRPGPGESHPSSSRVRALEAGISHVVKDVSQPKCLRREGEGERSDLAWLPEAFAEPTEQNPQPHQAAKEVNDVEATYSGPIVLVCSATNNDFTPQAANRSSISSEVRLGEATPLNPPHP